MHFWNLRVTFRFYYTSKPGFARNMPIILERAADFSKFPLRIPTDNFLLNNPNINTNLQLHHVSANRPYGMGRVCTLRIAFANIRLASLGTMDDVTIILRRCAAAAWSFEHLSERNAINHIGPDEAECKQACYGPARYDFRLQRCRNRIKRTLSLIERLQSALVFPISKFQLISPEASKWLSRIKVRANIRWNERLFDYLFAGWTMTRRDGKFNRFSGWFPQSAVTRIDISIGFERMWEHVKVFFIFNARWKISRRKSILNECQYLDIIN